MKRVSLNDILVYPFTSVDDMMSYIDGRNCILVAVNAEKVVMANDSTRNIINNNIGYCDGVGVVKALKQLGIKNVVKIAGCELWLKLIERYHSNKSFYLVGGKQNVIDDTISKLRTEYPDINIVGYRNGYLQSEEDREALIEDVATIKPDIVFVAMGSPKQEILMHDMQKVHPAVYQGLGGSFDVYTGYVKRAPQWWINHNLEFIYRVLVQPKRIKRQLHYLKFAMWLYTGRFEREQKALLQK